MNHSKDTSTRILVALDCAYATSQFSAAWAANFLAYLNDGTTQIDFLSRTTENHPLHDHLRSQGVNVLPVQLFDDPSSVDLAGVKPRFRSRQIVNLATGSDHPDYDIVLTQGLELSRYVAGSNSLQSALWSFIDDDPFRPSVRFPQDAEALEIISENSKLILTTSRRSRRQIESNIAASTSKTRRLSVLSLPKGSPLASTTGGANQEHETFVLDYRVFSPVLASFDFSALARSFMAAKRPPRIVLTHFPEEATDEDTQLLKDSGLYELPGLATVPCAFADSQFYSPNSVVLIPEECEEEAVSAQISAALLSEACFGVLSSGQVSLPTPAQMTDKPIEVGSFSADFSTDLPDYSAVPFRERPVRLLLAGADFKFAGDLVDSLVQRKDIDLRVDLFEANAKPQPKKSKPFLDWAEVIIAEFAAKNAIWYSQNVQGNQKLIVHLHGYELLQDWIDDLVVENCHRIVFASEFYRDKAIQWKQWPADKLAVVPNTVNPGDLEREKEPDARFHIGIVGIVPILKRPDRAIALLEKLLETDPRYVLHIKGHLPWNYAWEWKKSAHQDSYRAFYESIGSDPNLSTHVIFEPFSPDVGNWLTKIGWILSPSTRETFHLSAIEGASSGAVPIAWHREGSEEIIGAAHNVRSTEEAAERILSARSSEEFQKLSEQAKRHAAKYDVRVVRNSWLEMVFDATMQDSDADASAAITSPVFTQVEEALQHHDPEAALSILDESIPQTKSAHGPVKDLELFVRGMAALDEKRFTHFFPREAGLSFSRDIAVIRPAGATSLAMTLGGLDENVLDITPPNYLRLPERYVPFDDADDPLPDIGSAQSMHDLEIRLDRWVQLAKLDVQWLIESVGGTPVLVAQGPWWTAFAAAQAADEWRLPFVWILDGTDETIEALSDLESGRRTTNFSHQIARSVFERADLRIALDESLITPAVPYWEFDGVISRDGSTAPAGLPAIAPVMLDDFIRNSTPRRLSDNDSILLKPLNELRVGVVGAPDLLKELGKLVAEIVEIPIKDYFDFLSPDLDVVLIDQEADGSGPWKARISHVNEAKVGPPAKVFDRARLLGVPTVFLQRGTTHLPRTFLAAARKADAVLSASPESLSRLLQLHPTSITRLGLFLASASPRERWMKSLRSVGVPVK